MTPTADDALARALQELPVGTHAPIARIEQRANQLRWHRRASGLAGAAVATAAVVAALLAGVGDRLDLGPADAPTPCPTTDVPDIQWIPDRPPPEEIPDAMRLLWSDSAAPPPDIVVAKDLSSVYEEHHEYLAACSGPPSVRLIDVEDGVVSRFVWVGGGARIPDGAAPDRTLEVGSTQVEIFDQDGAGPPVWPGFLSASWSQDGQHWILYGGPVTDAELTELVQLLERAPEPGEPLEIDDWSVLAGAEFVIHWSGVDDESRLSYDVEAENILLHVIDAPGTVWPSSVFAGDRVVDVAGQPGILHEEPDTAPTLFWQPTDGVYATLGAGSNVDRLLEIAQT
ncbi:MAG: hypothetical protein ABWZ36_01305, partial [Jiangellaceae bacterium]